MKSPIIPFYLPIIPFTCLSRVKFLYQKALRKPLLINNNNFCHQEEPYEWGGEGEMVTQLAEGSTEAKLAGAAHK